MVHNMTNVSTAATVELCCGAFMLLYACFCTWFWLCFTVDCFLIKKKLVLLKPKELYDLDTSTRFNWQQIIAHIALMLGQL